MEAWLQLAGGISGQGEALGCLEEGLESNPSSEVSVRLLGFLQCLSHGDILEWKPSMVDTWHAMEPLYWGPAKVS